MAEKTVMVQNRAGIHARPAALIAQTANKFVSEVFMTKDGMEINAKSIMGVITMAAAYNSSIIIRTEGSDEEDALAAICNLFDTKFEED